MGHPFVRQTGGSGSKSLQAWRQSDGVGIRSFAVQ